MTKTTKIIIQICICFFIVVLSACQGKNRVFEPRKEFSLNANWQTIHLDSLSQSESTFVKNIPANLNWETVSVPHNWDQYYGYRRMKHGNLHGIAWYKKIVEVDKKNADKQHFLFFEGVGSYATVWVNGKKVGTHKGGRTTFTINISEALNFEAENTILVKAEHPAFIADLPWVCGGCSGEWGFSEGSQPMGIFRPVSLIVTNSVRIEPFGVHIWNENISKKNATVNITTELKNYSNSAKTITIENSLLDAEGAEVTSVETKLENFSDLKTIKQTLPEIKTPNLWSPKNPYLYQLSTKVYENGELIDAQTTPYGMRWVSWPINREGEDNRFYINGEPFFINGTCEYEHSIGKSHSFSSEEVQSRISQVKAAGYNAFREGHQPHNLRYQEHLDAEGILFWSQFSAHIWYDTPEFKENFKTLLKEWIKERRNNPSVVMWGLQNESTIPKVFAEECTQIIRELDPTSAQQRLVTTCNGGEGTDWNVIQNWSGTYGGDPYNYGEEMTEQLLNGEYGAWRSADLHTEGEFNQKGIYSENRFAQLMEIKVREAESVRDSIVGQYHWLLYSHENPGRSQNGEGYRDIDKVGPVNYKGIFTIWGEPTDAFYMYRANYVSNKTEPMVYIVSHSWPTRWNDVGVKNGIDVYSNCDEVELFNDVENISLGKLKNPGLGKHFQWNNVPINFNVLYAVGYVDGKPVAKDYIVLNQLPKAPHFEKLETETNTILEPETESNYLYRVNCGGSDYEDTNGNLWLADVHKTSEATWGSLSWTDSFENLPAFYASKRQTYDPIKNTKDWKLFQDFRYGANQLKYEFPAPEGDYQVELFFIEPWYGTDENMNCESWRLFDIAINGKIVEKNVDIWSEVGHDAALKKTYQVKSEHGKIVIHFPKVASGQAVISAIAISTKDKEITPAKPSSKNIINLSVNSSAEIASWLNITDKQFLNSEVSFASLPSEVFGADYIKFSKNINKPISGQFTSKENATVYVFETAENPKSTWLNAFEKTSDTVQNSLGQQFNVYKKQAKQGEVVSFAFKKGENPSTIAVVPEYNMEEHDDRPVLKLEAENAQTSGTGVTKAFFKKSDYVEFTENAQNSITFTVNPGVANIYLMRYRFMNMNNHPVKVRLKIEDANGILLRNDDIEFPIRNDKWKVLNTTSGGFINAGTYKITLESNNMKGLRIESFEFQ
ncbi:glycoside hydrolase [Tamlana nanhaiensis]|uniref:Glycoside hydrolase n=1 Tax=Neotamlana nanhaiensis TaxID=1382798 RepID=A0A0D7W989_9FLAO|nr:malectin domain-containing carbohydrate-binding protein [Tamlana nanhaiensis]KJD34347.1 glycoside hydrolase [Tamlana nanhaiensis]